jgi:hypothetical protein
VRGGGAAAAGHAESASEALLQEALTIALREADAGAVPDGPAARGVQVLGDGCAAANMINSGSLGTGTNPPWTNWNVDVMPYIELQEVYDTLVRPLVHHRW